MWKSDLCSHFAEEKSIVERSGNHIYFYSEVNRENIFKLNKFIHEVNKSIDKVNFDNNLAMPMNIYLHINSFGGSIFSALAAIDNLMNSKAPVTSIIEGCNASAGTLLSLVCKNRVINQNSYMLVHQLSSILGGKMEEIKDEYTNLENIYNTIKNIYKRFTKLPETGENSLENILKREVWLDSKKCLEYGLVDNISSI